MRNNRDVVDITVQPHVIDFPSAFNVAEAFIDRHVLEGRGDRPAIVTDDATITYAELLQQVNRFGNALQDQGLKAGDRILMVVFDEPQFFFVFWGAIKSGIIPIPVNTMLKPDEYAFLIDDSGCAAVVCSDTVTDTVAAGRVDADANPMLFTTGSAGLEGLAGNASEDLAAVPATPESECFWLYSSGSTGNPKGVVHAHRDMVVTSERYGRGIADISADDIVYCVSKLFFSYGFGGAMTFPLWAGAQTILLKERVTPDLTFSVIERFRPTVFFGVPTLYAQQINAAETTSVDMRSIRIGLSAGEALPAHVFERVRDRFGFIVLDGLGSTEALHIFVSNRANDIKPGTSGKPVAGYQVKIVDDADTEVPRGEIGTLWVKGQSTASKYWNNPEKTATTMRGDWLNTGDMYHVDAEGYYVNAGRGDDMFKVGGMWCSPIEIEAHLIRHPSVLEVAIVGRCDDDEMMKPEAFVVLKHAESNNDEIAAELTRFCKDGLAGYKYPRWFTFLDELPKTATGKVQRFKLRNNA